VEPIGHAIDMFGADRLMAGSDWPVAILAGDYQRVWTETGRALTLLGVNDAERAAILGGTAAAVYSIGG
jgi:L-fuconolactonase